MLALGVTKDQFTGAAILLESASGASFPESESAKATTQRSKGVRVGYHSGPQVLRQMPGIT